MHLPGGTQRERRKGGDKGAGSQGSSQIRLSRLQARSRGCPNRIWPGEPELAFSAAPCPSPRITTSPAPPTQRCSRRRARPLHVPADPPPTAPHPLGTGSAPGLPTEGREIALQAPPAASPETRRRLQCRPQPDQDAPCRWARAEQQAGHRPRPARLGGDASGRLSLRRAPGDPSHSALGRRG